MSTDTEQCRPEGQCCCPEGYPDEWHELEVQWHDKLFVKAHVPCFFYIPLCFGRVLKKNAKLAEQAGALPNEVLVMSDGNTFWGLNMYLAVASEVPRAQTVRLSGTFLTKVFEGPYKHIPTWIKEMERYVASKGRDLKHLYFLYRTCPGCAKKYGKNYVVLLGQM